MVKVKSIELIYDSQGLDSIKCHLGNDKFFDIEISDFYFQMIESDKNLYEYSKKFETWDELTNDLLGLGYPLQYHSESYINTQFTTEEIIEFTYSNM